MAIRRFFCFGKSGYCFGVFILGVVLPLTSRLCSILVFVVVLEVGFHLPHLFNVKKCVELPLLCVSKRLLLSNGLNRVVYLLAGGNSRVLFTEGLILLPVFYRVELGHLRLNLVRRSGKYGWLSTNDRLFRAGRQFRYGFIESIITDDVLPIFLGHVFVIDILLCIDLFVL